MKLKHLFALAAIAVSGSAWAQDVWEDVTSTYLTNADFEQGCDDSKQKTSTGGSRPIYCPTSWDLGYDTGYQFDGTALNSSHSTIWSNVSTAAGKIEHGGDNTYMVRFTSQGSNGYTSLTLTQTQKLPKGTYKISADCYFESGSTSNSNSRFIVYIGTTENTSDMFSSDNSKWVNQSYTFNADGTSDIKYGVRARKNRTSNHTMVAGYDNFKLEYNLTQALKDKITEASGIKIANDQSKYATTLEDAITEANNAKESQVIEELEKAISDLTSAITTYQEKTTIIQSLINVRTEIAHAEAYSVVKTENATAYAGAIQAAKDAIDEDNDIDYSDVILAMQNFKVEDYTYVTTTYTERKTVGSWTGAYQPSWAQKDQHWSGSNGYYSDNWENNMNRKGSQTINLPAGDYVFYAIGRSDLNAMTYIKVADVTTNFTPKGSEGLGVDKNGYANFTVAEDTYANDNKGYGWEYRFIPFHLDETTDVTLEFGYYYTTPGTVWGSISEPMLYMTAETKANNEIEALAQEIIDLVNGATIPTTNIGEGAFQYSQYAIDLVQDQKDMYEEATASDLVAMAQYQFGEGAADFLAGYKEGVQGDIDAMNILNEPAAGQKFAIVLTYAGWSWDNKAMTYIAGDRSDHGGYNIKYAAEVNPNYAQAFTMTHVEGNKYKMSQTDAEGNERYICTVTGGEYGNNNTVGVRTITDASKALVVELIPTSTDGVYNLWNTEANQYIGSQDAGVYTVNSHIDFKIVEATKANANLNIKAGKYGTFIVPFSAAIPNGVKAYTCESDENGVLNLSEANAFAANTAYIVKSESEAVDENLEGWGLATKDIYTTGYLTGVYSNVKVPSGSYILATKGETQAFYKVATDNYNAQANKCYITMPEETPAKALYFAEDADAIKTIEALTSGDAKIYNLNGHLLNSLQKGINIVNGRKVMVK